MKDLSSSLTASECYWKLQSATATTSTLSVKIQALTFIAADVEKILNWAVVSELDDEIPFKPARVIL
jgi:hypothetical protein